MKRSETSITASNRNPITLTDILSRRIDKRFTDASKAILETPIAGSLDPLPIRRITNG